EQYPVGSPLFHWGRCSCSSQGSDYHSACYWSSLSLTGSRTGNTTSRWARVGRWEIGSLREKDDDSSAADVRACSRWEGQRRGRSERALQTVLQQRPAGAHQDQIQVQTLSHTHTLTHSHTHT
ncbi:hypothetical protein PDJAM_G00263920, partial [Pangasius djambal]|nr:hypothetical protein [Pangasius djambal]